MICSKTDVHHGIVLHPISVFGCHSRHHHSEKEAKDHRRVDREVKPISKNIENVAAISV